MACSRVIDAASLSRNLDAGNSIGIPVLYTVNVLGMGGLLPRAGCAYSILGAR